MPLMERAISYIRDADLLIIGGTSLVVFIRYRRVN